MCEIPVVPCHIMGGNFHVPDAGDVTGGAIIAHHLASVHPVPAAAAPTTQGGLHQEPGIGDVSESLVPQDRDEGLVVHCDQ